LDTGEVHKDFRWEGLRKRGYLEDQGVDERIILKRYLKKLDGGMDWISLAQERGKWQDVGNAVVKLWISQNSG
jgi:hypothetical protein